MSERINCGNQQLEDNGMGCYICDLPEGHCGFHIQRDQGGTLRVWADTEERAEKNRPCPTCGSTDYLSAEEDDNRRQPTSFDKAWEKRYRPGYIFFVSSRGDTGAVFKKEFRAGWQAREKQSCPKCQAGSKVLDRIRMTDTPDLSILSKLRKIFETP